MSKATPTNKALNFDEATRRLEQIIELMDSPETTLEQMIALVEEGSALKKRCLQTLQAAELRIRQLDNPTHSENSKQQNASANTGVNDTNHEFSLL